MKILTFIPLALVATVSFAIGEEPKSDKTLGEKTTETLEKAKDKTEDAGRAVVKTTKNATKAVVDAVTPDADAAKVDVKLMEHRIEMPKKLDAGKTAFVVRNSGKEKHNFEVKGEGIDKKFILDVSPGDTKVLHVSLKSGTYKVYCPVKEHESEGMKMTLTVK